MTTISATSKNDKAIKTEVNKKTEIEFLDNLEDGADINFFLECNNAKIHKIIMKKSMDTIDNNDNDNNIDNIDNDNYLYDENTNKLYHKEIRYPEYFEYLKSVEKFLEHKNRSLLYNEDKIIYPCSYINIEYNYPNYNTVTFKIRANDNMSGFTTKELADKIIKYYHMLYMVNYGYNFDKGVFSSTNPSYIFHYYPDYDIYNGISGLKYSKKLDTWKVQMTSHIQM